MFDAFLNQNDLKKLAVFKDGLMLSGIVDCLKTDNNVELHLYESVSIYYKPYVNNIIGYSGNDQQKIAFVSNHAREMSNGSVFASLAIVPKNTYVEIRNRFGITNEKAKVFLGKVQVLPCPTESEKVLVFCTPKFDNYSSDKLIFEI